MSVMIQSGIASETIANTSAPINNVALIVVNLSIILIYCLFGKKNSTFRLFLTFEAIELAWVNGWSYCVIIILSNSGLESFLP